MNPKMPSLPPPMSSLHDRIGLPPVVTTKQPRLHVDQSAVPSRQLQAEAVPNTHVPQTKFPYGHLPYRQPVPQRQPVPYSQPVPRPPTLSRTPPTAPRLPVLKQRPNLPRGPSMLGHHNGSGRNTDVIKVGSGAS